MIFQTERLKVRKPENIDIEMYFKLWNSSEVIQNVGFPQGLKITKEKISEQIKKQDETEYDKTLVVVEKFSGKAIGECKLGFPNEEGISITDIKLLPEFWGNSYGKEIKNALCLYLFSRTYCKIVEASPNKENSASQKMQEICGGVKVRESVYHFPESMQDYTEDVHSVIYHIHKKKWVKMNLLIKKVETGEERSRICKKVILSLPGWFGLEDANKEYIENVADTDFYAAYMFDNVVGFFSVISHFPQTSEIYVCGILSEYHRLGIGRKLLKVIEKDLKKKGVNFLTVKTLSASHPDKGYAKTRKFYEAVGFVPLEEFKTLWGETNPCLFMVKEL
ncbi:MAG: N-acetyltransferase [Candidatus Cloacimonetes bacterium]|nr:N-acetyltransferase [Candidatus Cloacimonadota bacterium]